MNLLSPFLSLNATTVGQTTLTANLSQAIATNNNATAALQALSVSDKNLFGGCVNTITLANGMTATYGVAANLAGGLPAQASVTPSAGAVTTTSTTPIQTVGGLGAVLGPIFQTGVAPTNNNATASAVLANTATLLNTAYTNFTSIDLGVAKNYFADGAASNSSGAAATSTPAVAAAGQTLPTANGYPNTTSSVYDTAYSVTNTQANQDVYGSSRPVQVAPMATVTSAGINQFDSTSISGLTTNPSFPSGHTTYAYTDSILIARLVPQDYQSMLARASAYANSRIVLGVHYPLDIIASRALASYDLSQAFTNAAYQNGTNTTTSFNLATQFNAAKPEITTYLTTQGSSQGCGVTIAACSTSAANTANDPYVPSAALAASVVANLTYGPADADFGAGPQEAAPAGGPDASILLATLYGGGTTAAKTLAPAVGTTNGTGLDGSLTTATINQIIVNIENNALAAFYGTSLSYWTRINLYAAAGYLGNVTGTLSFDPTDVVTQNVTIASGGTLYANGSVTGATLVSAGGTLSGTGSVGATTIAAGGTLAPGGQTAIGTTTFNGAVTFAPGANYNIRVTPTTNDSTTVNGTATLNGMVNVSVAPGVAYAPLTQYTILNTTGGPGTIIGNFASVNTNLTFIGGYTTIVGDPTIVLTLQALPFNSVAQTGNQVNVGAGLTAANQIPLTPASANIIGNLQTITIGAQGRAVLDSLSGEGVIAAQNAAHRSVSEFMSSIFDQTTFYGGGSTANSITLTAPQSGFFALAPSDGTRGAPIRELADLPNRAVTSVAPLPAPRTWRAWATGFGGAEYILGKTGVGSASENNTIYGGTLGVDYQITPSYLAGIAVGGSDGEFSVAGRATSGSTTGGHIAFYDLATFGAFYGASSKSVSFFTNKTTRTVVGFGAISGETDRGTFDSHEFRTRLEFGRHFGASELGAYGLSGLGGVVTPFVALEIAALRSNGFSETNLAGPTVLGLNVQGQSTASVPSFAGARYQGKTALGDGMILSPSLQVAYVHEFSPQRTQTGGLINLPGSTFFVNGAQPASNAAQVKAGAELAIGPQSSLFATFDGEFSGQAQFYGGKGGSKYVW